MEEKGSDHDNVEDDVLRQKEFRRGGGIDLGQFMIRDDEEQPRTTSLLLHLNKTKPSEKSPPFSKVKMSNPMNLEPSNVMEPSLKHPRRIVSPTLQFMESVDSATVFSPGWSWCGLFLAGSSELHSLQ